MPISSDKDLPKCLNTPTKQAKKAQQLASLFSGVSAKKARGPRIQGFFSRTMIVPLENGQDVTIQFRPEPLDLEPFTVARRALGPVVPEIELLQDAELESNGICAYWMTCIAGKTWIEGMRGKDPKKLITINKSLGRILSKGLVEGSSEQTVNSKLRPHLELLLLSTDGQIQEFRHVVGDLLGKLDKLKVLPLFVSHFDLNEVNIMLDDDCEVSGLIDWELSTPLPFGMGFSRIHTLAGEYSEGAFCMPPEFDEAEKGFWEEIFNGIPDHVRNLIDANLDAVQTAITLGTLLDAFEQNNGEIGPYNPVVVRALPKHLTYRIPRIRGTDPPYVE